MTGPPAVRSSDALAFSMLDSEIRLSILDALYERTAGPGPFSTKVSYSSIQSAVGIEDSGRFNYHLDRLTDRFVVKSGGGYRLSESGRAVVHLRRTRTLTDDPLVEPEPVEADCYRCGTPLEAFYACGHLVTRCVNCDGVVDHEMFPSGTLSVLSYPPSGVSGVDIQTAFERVHRRIMGTYRAMADGFCPQCGHDVQARLPPREALTSRHDDDLLSCVTHDGLIEFNCTHCGQRRITHPLCAMDDHDPMAAYFIERDASPGWDRLAMTLSWDVAREAEALRFKTTDGVCFIVDTDLTVHRE